MIRDNVLLLNQATAIASGLASNGIDMSQMVNASVQVTLTGTPALSFIVEVSNDLVQPVTTTTPGTNPGGNVVNWAAYQAPVALSSSGSTSYNFPNIAFRWFRIRTTGTSTGGIIATYFAQGM